MKSEVDPASRRRLVKRRGPHQLRDNDDNDEVAVQDVAAAEDGPAAVATGAGVHKLDVDVVVTKSEVVGGDDYRDDDDDGGSPAAVVSPEPALKRIRLRPAGVNFNWGYRITPEEILKSVDGLITRTRAMYDRVGGLTKDAVTFANVVEALDEIDNLSAMHYYPLSAGRHFGISPEHTQAASEASKRWNEFEVETSMRKDLFDALLAINDKLGKNPAISAESKRYLEKQIADGKRIGLHLGEADRQKVESLAKQLGDLRIKFRRNLDESKLTLLFTAEELDGTPEVALSTMERTEDGKYKVTMRNPHVRPVLRSCKNAETRKKVLAANFTRCSAENGPILQKMLDLRHQKAHILGFKTHADYILEDRMAKTTGTVKEFLLKLAKDLERLWQKEKKTWIRHKSSKPFPADPAEEHKVSLRTNRLERRSSCDCAKRNIEFIADWDYSYLENLSYRMDHNVDYKVIQEYFPTEKVVPKVLKIFQKVLSLKFDEVQDAETWHDSVKMYQVKDKHTKEKMGYFFLDLFPREGKYGHAAMFELQPRWTNKDGENFQPVCAVLTNFTPPSSTTPSLLTHGELTTFFHEFGHVMHEICRRNKYYAFGLNGVDTDFVEAPSQMLENWAWEPKILKKLSRHHKTGKRLPDEMIHNLVKSKSANAGGATLRQVVLARLDQELHSGDGSRDAQAVFRDLQKAHMDIEPLQGTNFPAHFGHLAGGYDASYYGYLWSEVFSADMYHSVFKLNGIMDPATGLKYRKSILEPGGSRDSADMLADFLGRQPSNVPFLKSKGLDV